MFLAVLMILSTTSYQDYNEGDVSILIQVWGEVKSPGVYHVPPSTNLVEALSFAGGPTSRSDMGNIKLIKAFEKENKIIYFNVNKYLKGEGKKPPLLNSGDLLYIPQSFSSKIWDFVKFTSIVATASWTVYRIATD